MEDLLSLVLGIVFFPITLLGSWVIVHPQEEKLILVWGKLSRVLKLPGMLFVNIWGRKVITVTTKQQTIEIPKSIVADANGASHAIIMRWAGCWAGDSVTHSTDQSHLHRVCQHHQNRLINLSRTTFLAAPPAKLLWVLLDKMTLFQTPHGWL